MSSLTLYHGLGSCALAAFIALEESGAQYDVRPVRLADGEQRKPEFLAISPRGQVPVLTADGVNIHENIAVLTYVATRFPEARLLPFGEPLKMARSYEFLSWFATNLHMAFSQIVRTERFTGDETIKPVLRSFGRENFARALGTFEEWANATPGPWIEGTRFTLPDTLAPVAARWAKRLEIDLDAYPAFAGLAERVSTRPAALRAMQREQEGF